MNNQEKPKPFSDINKWSPADIYAVKRGARIDLNKFSTLGEFTNELKELYDKQDLVGISLKMAAGRVTTEEKNTTGFVRRPGKYLLQKNMTLYDLIFKSGGFVDEEFKIYGSSTQAGSVRYNLISQAGNNQLDDKDEYTVLTDNIARAVTNLEYEHNENEDKREINILKSGYLQLFINDLRDVVKYDKSSSYISSSLAATENTELVNP